jgi:hypothetical protein
MEPHHMTELHTTAQDDLKPTTNSTGADLHLVVEWAEIERALLLAALACPVGSLARQWLARSVAEMPGTHGMDVGPYQQELFDEVTAILQRINAKIELGDKCMREPRNRVERASDIIHKAIHSVEQPQTF